MEIEYLCPKCINLTPVDELCDEVWAVHESKEHGISFRLCEEHKNCNVFEELIIARKNTEQVYKDFVMDIAKTRAECDHMFVENMCVTCGIIIGSTNSQTTQ